MRIVQEIVHSCSNGHVAQAALGSIGGAFAARMEALAEREGLTAGVLAAQLVQRFEACADEREWAALRQAVRASEQPVLRGLQHIVEVGVAPARNGGGLPESAAMASRRAAPCASCAA